MSYVLILFVYLSFFGRTKPIFLIFKLLLCCFWCELKNLALLFYNITKLMFFVVVLIP